MGCAALSDRRDAAAHDREAAPPTRHSQLLPPDPADFKEATAQDFSSSRQRLHSAHSAGIQVERPRLWGTERGRRAALEGARFPGQSFRRPTPPTDSPLGLAASELYNLTMRGWQRGSMVQYLVVAAISQVFTEPTPQLLSYLSSHVRTVCHRDGPKCGGSPEALASPVVALHVRRGDSCNRVRDEPGPVNAFVTTGRGGKTQRANYRYCYSWSLYRSTLRKLQQRYGVRTVLLATDDALGEVLRGLETDKEFNWVYLDYPRRQFKKNGWMEFRKDLGEDVPLSLASVFELLGSADMLVGSMGSHVSRVLYNKMISSSRTSMLPPFVSVDGYGVPA